MIIADIATDIGVIHVDPKNKRVWINYVTIDGQICPGLEETPPPHSIVYICLNAAEKYALDLSCAQFGHMEETLTPLDVYVKTRVEKGKSCEKLSEAKESAMKNLRSMDQDHRTREADIHQAFENTLTQATAELSARFKKWDQILNCESEDIYHKREDHIMRLVSGRIEAFINSEETKTLTRKFDFQPTPSVIRGIEVQIDRHSRMKTRNWGNDYRGGPAFKEAVKSVKEQQKEAKSRWGISEP